MTRSVNQLMFFNETNIFIQSKQLLSQVLSGRNNNVPLNVNLYLQFKENGLQSLSVKVNSYDYGRSDNAYTTIKDE